MAGPKLTPEQKTDLRRDAKVRIARGTSANAIGIELGPKYGVSKETVRYYIAKLKSNGAPRTKRTGRRRSGPTPAPAGLQDLVTNLSELTPRLLKRVLAARDAQIALDKARADRGALRARVREDARRLKKQERLVKKLGRKLRKLLR